MSVSLLANGMVSNGSSPYGPTAGVTRAHLMNLNMELALASNPWLARDPISLERIATSGASPFEIMDNSAALAGIESAANMQGALNGLSPVAQRSVYSKLTEQQQRALNQMGYEPPSDERGFLDNTIFEGAWDATAWALDKGTQPMRHVVAPVAGKALDMLTWIGDVPAHFYRAIRQMEGWQQWLAAGAAIAAVAATGGLALAGAGAFGAGAAAMAGAGGAASLLGGGFGMGTLAGLGTLGGIGMGAGILATTPTAITNASEWWGFMNPWGDTGVTRGEKIFLKGAQEKARNILGGVEHLDALAHDIAAELDVYELAEDFAGVRDATNTNVMTSSLERVASKLADPGTQEYQKIYAGLTELMNQPEFQAAVDELQAGKISFGRDVANAAGLEQGDWGYGALSGGADALWLLTMDPLIGLGKIGKLQQLRRRGLEVPTGEDAIKRLNDMVNTDPMMAKTATQVADAVNTENILDMPKAWRGMFNPMLEYKRKLRSFGYAGDFDTKMFMSYIKDGDGLKRIMEGKGTVRGIEHIVVSTQNRSKGWGKFVESVRQFQHGLTDEVLIDDMFKRAKELGQEADLEKVIPYNVMDEGTDLAFEVRKMEDPAIREGYGYQAGRDIGKGLLIVPGGRSLGNFIGGITTMIPPGRALKLTGASADDVRDAADDIPRFVEAMGRHMNIPSAYRDEWINTIMRQGTASQRREALISFMESTFKATGWHSSDELKALADDMMYHYKQRYALGGADVAKSFDKRVIGFMPELHQAVYMVMPDLRAMSKIVRQGHVLKHVARLVDSNLAESAMSRVIKPGWLMRIGFIPRAAGEEMLAFAFRVSEGGIAQEFAARGAAKRRAIVDARRAFDENAGDLYALTAAQREALQYNLPTHLRPFNAIFSRTGWADPMDEFVENYLTWGANWRERGIFPGLGFLDNAPGWTNEALLGKNQSIRRMIVQGVDPDLGEAARLFLTTNSTTIMRATNAAAASDLERSIVTPNAVEMLVDDASAPNGRRVEEVLLRGERGVATPSDPRYRQSVHMQAQEWAHDGITREVFAPAMTNFKPPSFTGTNDDIATALEQMEVIDSWSARKLVGELLQPRQDNVRATAQQFRKNMPEVADSLIAMARDNQISASRMIDELEVARKAAYARGADPEDINAIIRLKERIEQVKPVLDRLEQMDTTSQAWLAAVMTRQISSENKAWDIAQVRAWADGATAGKRPRNVWYRGVPDASTYRIDAEGNLWMKAQIQQQWGESGLGAVSMSLDPQESLWFASAAGAGRGDNRVMTGAVIEIDGDFMLGEYSQTMEDLRQNTSLKRYTPESEGMHMLNELDQADPTEIAIVALEGDEVMIPAGKFKFSNTDEMQELLQSGTGDWAKNVEGMLTDIEGTPISEVAPKIDAALDEFVESLDLEERQRLIESMVENNSRQRGNLQDWNNEEVSYEGVLGDYLWQEIDLDIEDEYSGILRKWQDFLDTQIAEDLNARDALYVWLANSSDLGEHQSMFMLDDAIRERLGLRNEKLIQNIAAPVGQGFHHARRQESRFNRQIRDAFDLRGVGGFADIDTSTSWSPFVESFEDFRATAISEMAAQLARPEHADKMRLAQRRLQTKDGRQAVRPPADGLTRVYSPVVNPDHTQLDELLEQTELVGLAARDRAVVRELDHVVENIEGIPEEQLYDLLAEITAQIDGAPNPDGTAVDLAVGLLNAMYPNRWTSAKNYMDLGSLDDVRAAALKLRRHLVQTGESGYDAVAASLLRRPAAHRYTDPAIDALTDEQRIEILADALAVYDRSKARYAQGVSQPLYGLAHSDPRVSKWISSILADGDMDAPMRVAQYEVPRWAPTSNGASREGVTFRNNYEGVGNVFAMDSRYAQQAQAMDAPRFHRTPYKYTDETGKQWEGTDLVVGASTEEINLEWAEEIVDGILNKTRRGVKGNLRYRGPNDSGEQVARVSGTRMEALQPGEVIVGDEELRLIDAKGKTRDPIQYGDQRFFDTETQTTEDDLMWGLVGPMIRDVYEEKALTARHIPKELSNDEAFFGSFREVGPEGARLDQDLTPDKTINMTRSRIDDVDKEPANMLPEMAIKRLSTPVDATLWDRIVRYGFSNVIGPAIDALARKPMSFHYYAQAFKQNKRNLSWMLNNDLFENQFASAFARELQEMDGLFYLDDSTRLELASLADLVFNEKISDDVVDVQKWVATRGTKSKFTEELEAAHRQLMNKAAARVVDNAPSNVDDIAEYAAVNMERTAEYSQAKLVERVLERELDPQLFYGALATDGIGGRTAAERLVRTYHNRIPQPVWDEGMDSVIEAAKRAGLPHKFEGDQYQILVDARNNYAHAVKTADETATFRAMESVIPYLDSHEQRTMFGEYARNFIPFWYAEENFIKRWTRTLSLGQFATPFGNIPSGGLDTIRKAQLTYMGIKSAGIIRTDANGDDWVVYPGSGLLSEAVAKIMPGDIQPVGVLFAANTESLLPGITTDGHISPSPLIGVPSQMLFHFFPDSRSTKEALLGEIGSSRSVVSQFIPSIFGNAWTALFNDETSSVRYASAMMSAIAYAEADGNGLPENATAADIDAYLDKMRNHARIIMTAQAITGYVMPGSPVALTTGESNTSLNAILGTNIEDPEQILSENYREYITNLGIEDGTAAFLNDNAMADMEDIINPLAFTSSASESISRAPLPATEKGVRWYEDHKTWIDTLPEAGAWLIPQDGKDEFEYTAYRQQLAHGLRKRRTPEEFVRAIKYRNAATTYFEAKDEYDRLVLEMEGSPQKAELDLQWDRWRKPFLAANPIFAEELQKGNARIRRDRTVEQMRYAVSDPNAPMSPALPAIQDLVRSYDAFTVHAKQLRMKNTAANREKLRELKAAFNDWGTAWSLQHPDLERLWTSVYRIEAGI